MAGNLNAIIRYKTIDKCLRRKGHTYNWESLSEACVEAYEENAVMADAPSRRTIFGDVARMKSGKLGYEAPIVFNKKDNCWQYTDPNFSISGNPLNTQDLQELRTALAVLRQFDGIQMEGIEQIVAKLEDTLQRKNQDDTASVIQFEKIPNLKGQEWLAVLHQYALQRQAIRVQYQSFKETTPSLVILSPYLLKEYNNRWFLIGYNHKVGKVQNLSLDRIHGLDKELLTKFELIPQFNKDLYFKDIIGVSIPKDAVVEEILLEAIPEQAKYIETKPIHQSQQIVEVTEEGTVFSYWLICNFELESHLLSFGERVRVLQPEGLREQIEKRVKKMYLGRQD
jgi:predicted DNA-binding transcriptional regulator YafY